MSTSRTVIVDAAATLFARFGFERTSIQAIADATGYSKAGLLHHFPTKLAVYAAVLEESHTETVRVKDRVADLPVGTERDRRAVELLVDLALSRPGLVSMLLSAIVPTGNDDTDHIDLLGGLLLEAFDDVAPADARHIRVTGALVALGILALEARRSDNASFWRNEIIATALSTLGQVH